MRSTVCFAVITAFAAFASGVAKAQDMTSRFFGGATQFVSYGTPALTSEQSDGLAKFRREVSYFGAFAINEETGAWGYSDGYHSQRIAEQGAIEICQGFTRGRPCKLAGAILPEPVSPGLRNGEAISFGIEEYYKKTYLKEVATQKSGRYAAFALGGRGGGFETNARSAKIAKLKARRRCEAAELGNQKRVIIQVRNAFNRLGAYKCKVVEVRGPAP